MDIADEMRSEILKIKTFAKEHSIDKKDERKISAFADRLHQIDSFWFNRKPGESKRIDEMINIFKKRIKNETL